MSLSSPMPSAVRPLEEQARALVAFLAARGNVLALPQAVAALDGLTNDPKPAAKELRGRLQALGVDIQHTHALKAVAVSRAVEGFLGLGQRPRCVVVSWSPDVPALNPDAREFADIPRAADELCRRMREEYESASPHLYVRATPGRFDLLGISERTGTWWRATLCHPGLETEQPFVSWARLGERVRRLAEGELAGWVDGLFNLATGCQKNQGGFRGYHESQVAEAVAAQQGVDVDEISADVPLELHGERFECTQTDWSKLRARVLGFARKHGRLSPAAWAKDVLVAVDGSGFEPEEVSMDVFNAALDRSEMAPANVVLELDYPDSGIEAALSEGRLPLRHFPRVAQTLGLPSPNDLLRPGNRPQIPLRTGGALKMWLETVKVIGVSGDAPAKLTDAMQRIAEASTPGKTLGAKPTDLEVFAGAVKAAGLVLCAEMGVRFIKDLPTGEWRPTTASSVVFVNELEVATQSGQLSVDVALGDEAVSAQWLRRFNAPQFTGAEIMRYSDRVEELKPADADDDANSNFVTRVRAGADVFNKNIEKAHVASVRMEALSDLIAGRSVEPWIRRGRNGNLMVQEAAFEAAAKCPLVNVDGRPGFDFETFYMLCAQHESPKKAGARRDRYYLHGDESADKPGQYFCAQCDLFVGPGHFFSEHPEEETLSRYLRSLAKWQIQDSERRARRPDDASNMLDAPARQSAAAKEASRSAFHRWLDVQKGRGDPVGDLAGDVIADQRFPLHASDLSSVRRYMESRFASDRALEALEEAWSEFSETAATQEGGR